MKSKTKTTLKKAFLNVTAVIMALLLVGSTIANENAAAINTALGVQTYETVSADGSDSDEYVRYYESTYSSVAELKEDGYAMAEAVEAEGAVLLKNDKDALPLGQGAEVSLFGVTSTDPVYGGTGSGSVSAADAPDYQTALEEAGLVVNDTLVSWYESSSYGREQTGAGTASMGSTYTVGEAPWSEVESACGSSFGNGEAAIFVIGRVGGEGSDLAFSGHADGGDGDYLRLSEEEISVLEGLKALKDEGKISSIIVILNSSNALSCAFLEDEAYGIDAALWVGSVGQTGLYAVGDILAGTVNPSGSLVDTYWMDNKLNPAVSNFGKFLYEGSESYDFGDNSANYTYYVVYQEGIYLGYKYTETRYEDAVMGTGNAGDFDYEATVAYPFGYGLSYTTFEYSDMSVEKTGSGQDTTYVLSVTVTNTGDTAGKETVQVYAQKPYTDYDVQYQIEKASVELVGYGKTSELAPGASETITVEVPEYYLTSFDTYGAGTYILQGGTHYLTAAQDSHAAVNNILAAKGYTTADGMTDQGDTAMVYSMEYNFDSDTYSTAMGTGNPVTSLFDFADVNRYEGSGDNSVTYITRSDWAGTVTLFADDNGDGLSDTAVSLAMTDQIAADVVLDDSDIPADADGVEFPTMGSTETDYQLIDLMDVDYDDPMWDDYMDQFTYEQLSTLCAVGLRMTVGVEEQGKPETLDHNGPVGVTQVYGNGQNGYASVTDDPDKDLTGTNYPSNPVVAATFNTELVKAMGEMVGEDCMWAGYAGIYATGVNIHRTAYSGRNFEYYSEDSILSGLTVSAWTEGVQSKGVYVYNKHFALNDQESQRAGLSTWCNEQAMRENYLRAFELPILYADAKCVMSAFNRIGAIWSSASYELMTEWLRGEAGMSGFAVTDMYTSTYMSKPHMVLAGNDTADNYPGRSKGSTDAVSTDVLAAEFAAYGPEGTTPSATLANAMRESAQRILYTVLHSRGMDGIGEGDRIVAVTPWWETTLNVCIGVFGVATAAAAVLMVLDILKRKKQTA